MFNPLVGAVGFGNIFLIDGTSFLLDPSARQYLLASQGTLPSVNTNDTIAYIFQFTDIAQAESDLLIEPLMFSGGAQEVLVFEDTTIDSVTPLPGFWLMWLAKGGVRSNLYFHPNIQLCIDINLLNAGDGVLGSNLETVHIHIIVDNYGSFIPNGIPASV